jgi:peptidoglycan/xylan/chitin deacetylase (PgdA/CDA1 family)
MDEALLRLDTPHSRAFVSVTFDDGYRDTYERALPILERLNVPCTIYVPTHAVTRELYAWWLGLRRLFKTKDVVAINAMNQSFSCPDTKSKIAALRTVTTWVGHDFHRKENLRQTLKSNGISLEELSDKYFLSGQEIREIARRPLSVIGAHSTSHAALSILTDHEVVPEMSDNRNFLENLIGREVSHFAYPYGTDNACGEREFAVARRLGFKSGSTATNRAIGRGSSHHSLPRVDLTGPFWTTRAERLNSVRGPRPTPIGPHTTLSKEELP